MTADHTPWLTEAEQRVWRQWLTANAELTAALGRQLSRDQGISLPDFEVLVRLSEAHDHRVRIAELADGMQWERSRLSHHLTRMGKRGLIQRQDCPQDGRGQFAELTAAGHDMITAAAPGHVAMVRETFFTDLHEGDLDVLTRITADLLARLDRA